MAPTEHAVNHAKRLTAEGSVAELVAALLEAEAGLEFAGCDVPIRPGRFVPGGTLALQNIRAVLAKYPDEVKVAEDALKPPCECCGAPADYSDDDGVGTCASCAQGFAS